MYEDDNMEQFTLTLDKNWDIQVDNLGNLFVSSGDYAIAQNVACALRSFTNDMFFAKNLGVPHFTTELSTSPNPVIIKDIFENEAKKVHGVNSALCEIISLENRNLKMNILLELESNEQIILQI